MDDQEFWLTLAAVVVPTLAAVVSALLLHRSNRDAHAGIVQRIAGVDQSSVGRDEAHRRALESIARDVSFMAGRQTERDQQQRG